MGKGELLLVAVLPLFLSAEGKGEISMKKKSVKGLSLIKLQVVREEVEYYSTKTICNPKDVEEVVRKFVGDADREVFLAVNLNSANRINSIQKNPPHILFIRKLTIIALSINPP